VLRPETYKIIRGRTGHLQCMEHRTPAVVYP
jgi:hypothetical protein